MIVAFERERERERERESGGNGEKESPEKYKRGPGKMFDRVPRGREKKTSVRASSGPGPAPAVRKGKNTAPGRVARALFLFTALPQPLSVRLVFAFPAHVLAVCQRFWICKDRYCFVLLPHPL